MRKTTADTTEEKVTGEAPVTDVESAGEGTEEKTRAELESEIERLRDLAMRTQADFDNYRKRAAREKEEAIKYANTSFLDRLLPIIDSLDLGLAAAKSSNEKSAVATGMEMIARQLHDFLEGSGIEAIEAAGKPFDPHLHEALAQEESSEVAEGHVVRQVRKGFKLKDRLLRPANVIVSKGGGNDQSRG